MNRPFVLNLKTAVRTMSEGRPIEIKPIRSELHYRGNYRDNAFDLLTAPAALYKSLLKHLGQFGAILQNIKWEAPSLADSHVSCSLPEMGVAIRVRIDRAEIDFWRFQESSTEIASRIVLGTWAAIGEVNPSIGISAHTTDISIIGAIEGETCLALMKRYVRTPEALGVVDLGVAFYDRPIQGKGMWVNVVLDRVFGQDHQLIVKLTLGIGGDEVALDNLAIEMESFMTATLDKIGLRFAADDRK